MPHNKTNYERLLFPFYNSRINFFLIVIASSNSIYQYKCLVNIFNKDENLGHKIIVLYFINNLHKLKVNHKIRFR